MGAGFCISNNLKLNSCVFSQRDEKRKCWAGVEVICYNFTSAFQPYCIMTQRGCHLGEIYRCRMFLYIDGWMDGWMDGWVDGWMD